MTPRLPGEVIIIYFQVQGREGKLGAGSSVLPRFDHVSCPVSL